MTLKFLLVVDDVKVRSVLANCQWQIFPSECFWQGQNCAAESVLHVSRNEGWRHKDEVLIATDFTQT